MGTYVESAYIERLQEDIEIACQRLSEQGLETLVVSVGNNIHHVLGSQKGRIFLKDKDTFIAEFVTYCEDTRPKVKPEKETITLFDEQGKSIKLQDKSDLNTELVNFDSLNTPATADNDSANVFENENTNDFDDTHFFNTDILANLKEEKEDLKNDRAARVQSYKKKKDVSAVESDKGNKETVTLPRRSLRNAKKGQSNNIVENLPHVKGVLTKLKDSKQNNKGGAHKSIQKPSAASKSKRVVNQLSSTRKISVDSKSDDFQSLVENTETKEINETKKAKFDCYICKEETESAEELNTHMAAHKALACHMCKKIFKTNEVLQEHKQVHIDKNEYNECQHCDKVFKFDWQLGEHIEKEHMKDDESVVGNFPCSSCGHTFKHQLQLTEHNERNPHCGSEESEVRTKQSANVLFSEIHFMDPVSGMAKKKTVKELLDKVKLPATCEICGKMFDKAYNFKRHVFHHSDVKPHKCIICCQQFQIEDNHKKHIKLHDLRLYYCTNCSRRFETRTRLDHHVRFNCKKNDEKPDLTCDECGHQAKNMYSLEAHRRVHTGIKPWSCEICGKMLSSRDSIIRHKLVFHQEERPYECEQCGRRFKIKDTLKKHQKTHGEKKYRCEICGKLWVDKSDLKKHRLTHNENREKNYICDQCGQAFRRKIYLDSHRFKHTGEAPFKCDREICGKGCVESGNLKKHMMTHTKEKPFVCETCGKAYGRRSLLDNHIRLHTGEKPYLCDIEGCNKSFRSYGNLKQHKATHSQGHDFICDICGKTFKVKSRMNHHRKNHTIDWRWPCSYCGEKYKSIFMYKNHLAKCHPEMKDDIEAKTNIRLYQCDICQKMYGDKEDLTRHIYIHKGLKPFSCRFCGKNFNDKSNRKCHEKIHTGEKNLSCPHCYKTFIQPRALKMHVKNVHGQTIVVDGEVKMDESVLIVKAGDHTEEECRTAVETVLQPDMPVLTEMRSTSAQAVMIAQDYPSHSMTQTSHLFPNLVKEFEPLMIVESYQN